MKMQRRRWPILIAGTLLVATTGTALAFGAPGNCGAQKPMGAVYRLDSLTESQRQQLDAIREQRRAAMQERGEWRSERRQLREAIRNGAAPESIRPLADQQGRRIADRLVRKAEMRREVMAILTPEQQQELEQITSQRGGKRGHMHRGF